MKRVFSILPLLFTTLGSGNPAVQFMTTVDLEVHEPTEELTTRSLRLIETEFDNSFRTVPAFQEQKYEVRRFGNGILFSLTGLEDRHLQMQQVVKAMLPRLIWKVQASGSTRHYRMALPERPQRGFRVRFADDATEIEAVSVPLRDLLREIQAQNSFFNYQIATECAEKTVDWSYRKAGPTNREELGKLVEKLVGLFNMESEQIEPGYFALKGSCETSQTAPTAAPPLLPNAPFENLALWNTYPNVPTVRRVIFFPVNP